MKLRWRISLALGLALGWFVAVPARAQPIYLDTPDESPLWWPLSESTSKEDLQRAWRDPDASRQRFRDAVKMGLAQPVSEEVLGSLKFYLHPRLTPQWIAMFQPFQSFSASCGSGPEASEAAAMTIARYGVSPSGRSILTESCLAHEAETRRIVDERAPRFAEVQRLIRDLWDTAPEGTELRAQVARALEEDDFPYLAARTGRSEIDVRDLVTFWKAMPTIQVTGNHLRHLRARLEPSDWLAFRRFLREEIAAREGAFVDF